MNRAVRALFGGTFDPIHVGHLRMAIESLERLQLDRVDFMPAADPPLKARPQATAAQRLAMVRLAVSGVPGLGVDDRELARAGPSYTVDTLRQWRSSAGGDASLVFIVGADVLPQLPRWHEWQSLLELCHIAVLHRPGTWGELPDAVQEWLSRYRQPISALKSSPAGAVIGLAQPPLTISSSDIRAAIGAGKNTQFLLPEVVIEYIHRHGLYRSKEVSQDNA